MSLNYSLTLEAKIEAAALLSNVNKLTGIPYVSNKVLADKLSGLWISAHLEDDKWNIELCEEQFKFTPFVWLAIVQGKFERVRNDEILLTVVAQILKETEGDMVLQFQSDSTVLKRINGQITFNSEWKAISVEEHLTKEGFTFDIAKMIP